MKYCMEYAALLDLFVDGELEAEEMVRVQEHLETCPGCQAYVDDALAIRAGFAELDTEVPEGFAEGVMEKIRAESSGKRNTRRRWTGALAALAACCAIVVLLRSGPVLENGAGMDTAASVASAGNLDEEDTEAGVCGGPLEEGGEKTMITAASGSDDSAPLQEAAPEISLAERRMSEVEKQYDATSGSGAASPMLPEAADDYMDYMEDAALVLTAGEAGDLLDEAVPVLERDIERHYVLTREEYTALTEGLEQVNVQTEEPGTDRTFLVIVIGPF